MYIVHTAVRTLDIDKIMLIQGNQQLQQTTETAPARSGQLVDYAASQHRRVW